MRSRGRPAAVIPARTDLSMHASNGPREGTSHILFPPSRRLRRPAAQESGGSIAEWYGQMRMMPFYYFLSVPRPTHGQGSVRPIRCRGAPYDDEPGARGANITLTCRRTRPSAQKSGCPIAGWYGTMGPMPHIRSADRLAAGNSENCLPRAPGWGVGSVNKVFTATYQLITVG